MSLHNQKYDEPEKNEVRSRALTLAVQSLTINRDQSPLVSRESFIRNIDFVASRLESRFENVRPALDPFIQVWLEIQNSRVGARSPNELHVLILCGPNPRNDYDALLKLGIPPFNIWAVESDAKAYGSAVQELRQLDIPFKIHKGSLQEFFAIVPQQFDIVYFDACGPLASGNPDTLSVLRELFVHQRLSPLSVLVTNFSKPTLNGKTADWPKKMATWFAHREWQPANDRADTYKRLYDYRNSNDDSKYLQHIERHFDAYYDYFITTFVSDFASQSISAWRVAALPASARELFVSKNLPHEIAKALSEEAIFMPGSYQQMWPAILSELLAAGDPLHTLFRQQSLRSTKLLDALTTVALVKNFDDVRTRVCSPDFSNVLNSFRWFDSKGEPEYLLFCDTPRTNLIVDLIVGQLGYPFHLNVEKMARFRYTAKVNEMFTDVFIFDQARYLYDLVPSLSLFKPQLELSLQMVLRVCIDGIRQHTMASHQDLFYCCALAGLGQNNNPVFDIPKRILISRSM